MRKRRVRAKTVSRKKELHAEEKRASRREGNQAIRAFFREEGESMVG